MPVGDYIIELTGQMTDFSSVDHAATKFKVSVTSIYDQINILDVPKRQFYPSPEEIADLPLRNYKLSQVRYK